MDTSRFGKRLPAATVSGAAALAAVAPQALESRSAKGMRRLSLGAETHGTRAAIQ